MAARGVEQTMQVTAFDTVPADAQVAHALKLSPGASVLQIKRRHLLRGNPIAYAIIYLPSCLSQTFTLQQVTTTPIYTLLTRNAQIKIKRATQIARAQGAAPDVAAMLKLPRGAPVLMIERVTYSSTDEPVEYILFFYRGDSYELVAELHREPTKNTLCHADGLGCFAPDS
jgi:GntR family transcriptional regulator